MAIAIRAALDKIKAELEAITPSIGRVYARLQFSPEAEDVITDYKFEDPALGEVIKAFIIAPGNGRESRGTTGKTGFALAAQNIVVTGFVSMNTAGDGAPDLVLEDAFETIRTKLRALQRLQDVSQGDAFFTGEMDWTRMTMAKIANHNVLVKELTLAVQDRKL